jgi:hypothetical protein
MNFFAYSLSGFLIARYFFSKNKIEEIFLGSLCVLISMFIRYEATNKFDLGMTLHIGGVIVILFLIALYKNKKNKHQ